MLSQQLKEIIDKSLENELYSNVVFYAEKLLCEYPKDERVRYLLAKGYIGEGKQHKAYEILRKTGSINCRYLFAQICMKLNKYV